MFSFNFHIFTLLCLFVLVFDGKSTADRRQQSAIKCQNHQSNTLLVVLTKSCISIEQFKRMFASTRCRVLCFDISITISDVGAKRQFVCLPWSSIIVIFIWIPRFADFQCPLLSCHFGFTVYWCDTMCVPCSLVSFDIVVLSRFSPLWRCWKLIFQPLWYGTRAKFLQKFH